MSDTLYELPEDVRKEFRLDHDGKVFAKSVMGISRLCGCSDSSIHALIAKSALGGSGSPALKPFAGRDFKVSAGGYPDLFVAACVKHFACFAQVTNETAIRNDAIFSAIGVRACFQSALGWQEKSNSTDDLLRELLRESQATRQELAKQSEEIASMRQQLNQVARTNTTFPGVQIINNFVNNILMFPSTLTEPFSLRDWAEQHKRVKLTKGQCKSLGRAMAASISTLKQRTASKNYDGLCIYLHRDMPAMEPVWSTWIEENSNLEKV